jgi:methionine synthase II (cobalamin-independent)
VIPHLSFDHHTLQVERPDQVAALIREALKNIPPERLIVSSDCGMGREGTNRRLRRRTARNGGVADSLDEAKAV